ncbi:DNA topoisomerase [Photobacterium galatheae]|uniref:DNA topoisomerase n=1 Tax=Photobacterium galatheae TaxID=1654360 RepID=A0A066RQK0_9GAMM|nr:DNA topoisomerase [Photobacterium galatheae]KDM89972.1 hypothetical protein EA58_19705 [Photobacterium galatheae]MCM0149233.1 hypothetical protein [Photobacterium galatheae]
MKLYITENKHVAEAFIPVLGRKSAGSDGLSYVTSNGDVVTWLSGHVLELIDAKDYDPKYAKWDLNDLPILPDPFVLRPIQDKVTPFGKEDNAYKRKILNHVLSLIKKANTVCLATDPDAEGELLGREVITYSQFQGTLTRVLPTSLEVGDIKACLANEFSAKKTELIGKAGLARSHIDWIVGINTTVGLTAYNKDKISKPLNAGRVQTAIIQILHMNHVARETFVPQNTYEVHANACVGGASFELKYMPSKEESDILDARSDGYHSKRAKAFVDTLTTQLNGKNGVISSSTKQRKQTECPKGYSLSDLQIDMNQKFGMTAADTLAATQSLYDKKYVTYPRTDNNYFPEDAHHYAAVVLSNLSQLEFAQGIQGINPNVKNSTWDTSKFDNHHAILPTRMKAPFDQLGSDEQVVYEMICRRYMMQFLPNYEYDNTTILVDIDDAQFKATGNIMVNPGWKQAQKGYNSASLDDASEQESDKSLPMVEQGTVTTDTAVFTRTGKTQIPALYTEAKILQILKNPAKLIENNPLKKVLKERQQGIGRESTRATILKQMLANGFYSLKGNQKHFQLTEKGLVIAEIAPPMLLDLSLTAKLEHAFWQIEKGELTYEALLNAYQTSTKEIITSIKRGDCKLNKFLVKTETCFSCKTGTMTQRTNREKKQFWKCTDCHARFSEKDGKPVPRSAPTPCPKCHQNTLSRFKFKSTKEKFAWYCKPCRLVVPDKDNQPCVPVNFCKKCASHINYGYSADKMFAYWQCSHKKCNTYYADNNLTVGKEKSVNTVYNTAPCPKCDGELRQFTRKSDGKKFWLCSNREVSNIRCRASYADKDDEPITEVPEVPCPSCKSGVLRQIAWNDRVFWGCSNYKTQKQCRFSAKDNHGKPILLLND